MRTALRVLLAYNSHVIGFRGRSQGSKGEASSEVRRYREDSVEALTSPTCDLL